MLLRSACILATTIAASAASMTASAGFTLDPTVDWRAPAIGALCEGNSSCTTGTGILIESFRTDGGSATMDHSLDDGLGIRSRSYENDEIEGKERLRFTFPEEVILSSLFISDSFANEGPGGETGFYKLDDGDWIQFAAADFITGPGNKANGELQIDLDEPTAVTSISFRAPELTIVKDGKKKRFARHEFAVIGVELQEVSTPAPLSLLLLGGLFAKRRKKQALAA